MTMIMTPPSTTATPPQHHRHHNPPLPPCHQQAWWRQRRPSSSDLNTIFSSLGKVAKVSVLKDRKTRPSRGVAFILFVSRDDAVKAVKRIDKKLLNGRTLTASIASDNGRKAEFLRKRVYKDNSRCYQCGEERRLSYECPKNLLGPRERPASWKKGGERMGVGEEELVDEEEEEMGMFEMDNWASRVDKGRRIGR